MPLTDRDWAQYLAEQIRRAIAGEHLPRKRSIDQVSPLAFPRDPGLCTCPFNLSMNNCARKILEAAFHSYADAHGERFPIT